MVDALEERRLAAKAAADLVEPGMCVGLGTGRTALLFIEALGQRIADGLAVPDVVPTSDASEAAARSRGFSVCDMMTGSAPTRVDLGVDGADEVDGALRLIKGGGGSLLREKIVAQMADRFVVIADSQKRVATLGAFPLPVEVVPFGWRASAQRIEAALGVAPTLRRTTSGIRVTDNGNYILDCPLGAIADPEAVVAALVQIPGVVEHGLFLFEADEVLIGTSNGVERLTRTP